MASRSKNVLIVAGEASGDLHGARLMGEMTRLDGNLTFFGIGGASMGRAGVELLEHVDNMAVMGFTEVLGKYPFLRTVYKRVLRECERRNPVRAILIDYPGFNLTLARRLAGTGIPVTYYIPPQVWAWREKRVKTLKEVVDQILCIFPFEERWYGERGVSATFVGHPLLDQPEETTSLDAFRHKHRLGAGIIALGLMPGSRQQEVDRHLPVMARAVRGLAEDGYEVKGVIGRAPGVELGRIEKELFSVEEDRPQLVLRFGTFGLVASGTATLEGAIFGTPCVVIYRMSAVSWEIGRRLAGVGWVALPNLIADEEIFPELLQREATGKRAAALLRVWIESSVEKDHMKAKLGKVREQLGGPGASRRAARLILERLDNGLKVSG
ncbi:MAG: lipid-A-disaccharide synthase [Fidelibacterota bacterium]